MIFKILKIFNYIILVSVIILFIFLYMINNDYNKSKKITFLNLSIAETFYAKLPKDLSLLKANLNNMTFIDQFSIDIRKDEIFINIFHYSQKIDFKIFKSLALMNRKVSTINNSNLFFKNLFSSPGKRMPTDRLFAEWKLLQFEQLFEHFEVEKTAIEKAENNSSRFTVCASTLSNFLTSHS